MKFFDHMVGTSGQGIALQNEKIYGAEERINTDFLTTNGFYFFKAYLSADFSTVKCDKKYFFVYSSDHAPPSSLAAGMYWGKGNKLDLTDFFSLGKFFGGQYQEETPSLYEKNGKLFIYYHTRDHPDSPFQDTRLITYTGAEESLNNMNFVEEGKPLGIVAGEDHTGYFKQPFERGNDLIGLHIAKGGLPQPWKRSVSTDGGFTYTREATVDTITNIEPGYFFKPSEGEYFDYKGQQFWIGTIQPDDDDIVGNISKRMIIAKSNTTPYDNVIQKKRIYDDLLLHVHSAIREEDIMHIYFSPEKDKLFHAKYDLKNLDQWLD